MAKAETAILDQAGITRAVTRIAHEILEHNKGCEKPRPDRHSLRWRPPGEPSADPYL